MELKKLELTDISVVNQFIEDKDNRIDIDSIDNDPFNEAYVIIDGKQVVGYLNYAIIYERIELNYICIDRKYRAKGYAKRALSDLILLAKDNNCQNITLEVREDNMVAINLYQKLGFKIVAKRNNYYNNIDGLLMIKELGDKNDE